MATKFAYRQHSEFFSQVCRQEQSPTQVLRKLIFLGCPGVLRLLNRLLDFPDWPQTLWLSRWSRRRRQNPSLKVRHPPQAFRGRSAGQKKLAERNWPLSAGIQRQVRSNSRRPPSTYLGTMACGTQKSASGEQVTPSPPSRPGELHPEPLTDPDVNLSLHPARATREGYPASSLLRSSAPLAVLGTFGLMGPHLYLFPWHHRTGSQVPYESPN